MKTKILIWLCKNGFHRWIYSRGGLSRECKFCGKHQITVGDFETPIYDHFETNINGKYDRKLTEGDRIKITWLSSCINVTKGTPNPYIGMSGEARDLKDGKFNLFTGNSWLCGVEVNKCKFDRI